MGQSLQPKLIQKQPYSTQGAQTPIVTKDHRILYHTDKCQRNAQTMRLGKIRQKLQNNAGLSGDSERVWYLTRHP